MNKSLNTTTLTFEYGSNSGYAISNTITTSLKESMEISKTSLGTNYYLNENITFLISLSNNSNSKINDLIIIDDLGSYYPNKTEKNLKTTPLTYTGPSFLYINGKFNSEITPKTNSDNITFNISSIPDKSHALIIYKTTVNDYAPLKARSQIKSTAKLTISNRSDIFESSNIITVSEKADVKIIKNLIPSTFSYGDDVTYDITLYNYGNSKAENIILEDNFQPSPMITNVKINHKEISFTDYSYINGLFTLPNYNSHLVISIPPAQFIENTTSGKFSVIPGTTHISITGKL